MKKEQKVGRPSNYKKEYCEMGRNYALLGATDKEMAAFFGVSEVTLNSWKKKHPEFLMSLKEGKEVADSKVAEKLFHRALGYEHPDVHISNFQGEITQTDITKHYPPDTTAAIFWLKNRQKANWRDKQEVDVKSEQTVTHELPPELMEMIQFGKQGSKE